MNIFLHELKACRKSIAVWSCSMAALAIMYVFIYKGLGSDIEDFKVFVSNLPDVMKKAFSIYLDSISTLVGFYSFIFSFVLLCGAIQAMNIGTSIVSKEVSDKTADFLLTKPVSRKEVLASKTLAAAASLLITNIIYLGLTIPVAAVVTGGFDVKLYLLLSATLFFVQLMFAALGIIISAIAGKIKSVLSVSLSTVFGLYILGTLGEVVGENTVRYISPFRYFDAYYIINNRAYEASFVIAGIIFVAAAIAASFVIYVKKDIHAV